jgi:hypothetical protein
MKLPRFDDSVVVNNNNKFSWSRKLKCMFKVRDGC